MATLVYAVGLVISVAWMWFRGDPWQRWGGGDVSLLLSSCIGTGIGLVVVLLGRLLVLFSWARALEAEFADLIGPLRVKQIIWLAIVSSVAEEAFFRGAVQPTLGLMMTSILFGLLHFGPRVVFIPWTMMALGMGFVLGFLADWSGGLLASVSCHFTINAINLWFISIRAHRKKVSSLHIT